jgi:hypothetical protein
MIAMSSAFAGDIVIQSFAINSSFPNPEDLLKQEVPKYEGKDVRVPYMICGVLPQDQVLKFREPTSNRSKTAEAKVDLPNGGVAEVTVLTERTRDGLTQFDSKIQIRGPGSNTMETTITTYDGDGILIRCDAKGKDDPQLIFLQIKKES